MEPREVTVYKDLTNVRLEPVESDFRPHVTRVDPTHPSVAGEMPPGNAPAPSVPPYRLTDTPGGEPGTTEPAPEWTSTAPDPQQTILEEMKTTLLNRCNAIADAGRGKELRAALDEAGLPRVGEAEFEQLASFDAVIATFEV